jgi:hypothetical protein
MTCINCGHEANEKFCGHCGQRTDVKRITFKDVWSALWISFTGFDGMFPRTLTDLTVRPGDVANLYIKGNRAKYYGPVGYFLLMITLFLVLMSAMDVKVFDLMNDKRDTLGLSALQNNESAKISQVFMRFVSDNIKLFVFMIPPFQALVARYLIFRKSGLNYMENIVLPYYLLGHLYWLSIASGVIFKFGDSLFLNSISNYIGFLFYGYAYSNFISYQPKWKSFLKGLGVYVVGQVTFVITFSVVAIIGVLILFLIDPDMLKEMMRPFRQ